MQLEWLNLLSKWRFLQIAIVSASFGKCEWAKATIRVFAIAFENVVGVAKSFK